MGAIGAMFSFKSKTIDAAALTALKNGMGYHSKDSGHDGGTQECGLAQSGTPPYFDAIKHIGIAANARLFNRAELTQALAGPGPTPITDTQLILLAYLKWDLEFVSHLVGEFRLALWDMKLRRLVVAVDHFNARPLYYFYNQDILVISSVMSALHGLDEIAREPNLGVIARHDFKRFLYEPGETCFKDIQFLAPAHLLIAEATGMKIKPYWRPTLGEPLLFRREADFQEAFESHFAAAVRATLDPDKPTCLLLSGGLDSSAIALMAAQVMRPHQHPLICLSNGLPSDSNTGLVDEQEYIDLIQSPHFVKETVSDGWRGPFDHLDFCARQLCTNSQHYQHHALNAAARRHNASVLLHGTLAELTTSYSGYEYLSELLHHLRWLKLAGELWAHRKVYRASFSSLVGLVMHPRMLRAWPKKSQNPARQYLLTNSFIRKEFVVEQLKPEEREAIEQQFLQPSGLPTLDARHNCLAQLERHLRHTSLLFTHMEDGVDTALHFSNPYFDKRLVEFCLNIPNQYRFRDGYPRSIIRIGMQKYLPNSIRYRTTKSPFLPDYHVRYNRQIKKARAAVEALQNHPLVRAVVDIPRLLAALDRPSSLTFTDTKTETNFMNYHGVPQAVYLAVFLSSF